jgi:thioredoxin 1
VTLRALEWLGFGSHLTLDAIQVKSRRETIFQDVRRREEMLREVNKDNFDQEVVESQTPVLVDFWGPRCGPCLALMPYVEEMASDYENALKVVKVDASQNRRLCLNLRVMNLPTYLLFKDGKEVDRLTGEVDRKKLKDFIVDFVEAQEENV